MSGPGDLYAAAEELLAAAAECIAVSPGGPIGYQAVVQGLPSFDCPPALYVSVGADTVGDTLAPGTALAPLQRIVTTGWLNVVVFTVTVIRCMEAVLGAEGQNLALPSAALVSEDAELCYGDLWALWNGLSQKHREGTLFQDAGGRREFGMDPAIPVRTEGGAGGWILQVRAQVPGYSCL